MQISFKLENYNELRRVFNLAPATAAKEFKTSLDRIATKVWEQAIHNAPVNKGEGEGKKGYGGNLRQSIKKTPYGSTGFVVRVNAEYGVYVDQGTRPHVILPRTRNFLAFKKDGHWIFARRVYHPGTKATHFFTDAVKEGESYGNREMNNAIGRVLQSLSK